jgi:cobalt-precorrin 5A hydrolase
MMIAGFGYRAGATTESLRDAYDRLGGGADAIAVPADKAGALCLKRFAAEVGLPVHPVSDSEMHAVVTPTQSTRVIKKRGTGSVAEACALAVAGAEGRLIAMRHISEDRMATCALAERGGT